MEREWAQVAGVHGGARVRRRPREHDLHLQRQHGMGPRRAEDVRRGAGGVQRQQHGQALGPDRRVQRRERESRVRSLWDRPWLQLQPDLLQPQGGRDGQLSLPVSQQGRLRAWRPLRHARRARGREGRELHRHDAEVWGLGGEGRLPPRCGVLGTHLPEVLRPLRPRLPRQAQERRHGPRTDVHALRGDQRWQRRRGRRPGDHVRRSRPGPRGREGLRLLEVQRQAQPQRRFHDHPPPMGPRGLLLGRR
mmetsp:Transcript_77101/g.216338  ORF Transcript_77101/g.216338 Transcript_77101/m.216338 type:complete len:249 (+) Transcript_77101:283-1029(+)